MELERHVPSRRGCAFLTRKEFDVVDMIIRIFKNINGVNNMLEMESKTLLEK